MSEEISKEKNYKSKDIILLVIIIVCAISIGFYIYIKELKGKQEQSIPQDNTQETLYEIDEDNYNPENYGGLSIQEMSELVKSIKINTSDNIDDLCDAYVDRVNNNKFVLYRDSSMNIKLYDSNKKESQLLNNADIGQLYVVNNRIIGIITDDFYYSIIEQKQLYNNKNYKFHEATDKYLLGYVEKCKKKSNCTTLSVDVLSTTSEKVLHTFKPIKGALYLGVKAEYNDNGTYFLVYDYDFVYEIYNENFKLISSKRIGYYDVSLAKNGNIYISSNNKIIAYNQNGKVVLTKKYDGSIYRIIKGYALLIENSKLYLVDPNGKKIELMLWNKKSNDFAYYEINDKNEKNANKDNIIYVVIIDSRVTKEEVLNDCSKYECNYDEFENFGYEIQYNTETGEITRIAVGNILTHYK